MIDFVTLLILGLASYRLTRLFLFDAILDSLRNKLHAGLANASLKGSVVKRRLSEFLLKATTCSWCLGVYVTFAVYWLYVGNYPQDWGRLGWLTYAGITGLQGMLHAFEPDDA